jgi:hypothetical protein
MGARNRTTEEQYDYLDGNLALYLNRLARNSKARIKLTRKDLRDTWDRQMGRCALTGIPMTFRAVAGECFPFNASIDCVLPRANGGTYEPANIRLVCSFVNAIRRDRTDEVTLRALDEIADALTGARNTKQSTTNERRVYRCLTCPLDKPSALTVSAEIFVARPSTSQPEDTTLRTAKRYGLTERVQRR